MVMAKLHVICGNCGSDEMLTHYIEKDYIDHGDMQEDAVIIRCGNCSTLHTLSDKVPTTQLYPFDAKVEEWRHDSEELEAVHHNLDDHGAPRHEDGNELSTWGRILRLFEPTKRS